MTGTPRATSVATDRARSFVAAHRDDALALGRRLGGVIDSPDEFVEQARTGLRALADPEYAEGVGGVAPGVRNVLGVRTPLLTAVERGLRPTLRRVRPAEALWIAEALAGQPEFELRLLVHPFVRRAIEADPERSWQLIRRIGRQASEWITVDSLAHDAALGILLEDYRWAELEQLTFAPSRWERRLVGSTIATLPFEVVADDRPKLASAPALSLVASLVGDDEPVVQKALSWALRSWARVDPDGVARLLDAETARAVDTGDGARAWVIRDALPALGTAEAARLRARLSGIRRRPGQRNTSRAHAAAQGFGDLMAAMTAGPAGQEG